MKIWEAIAMLEQMDKTKECTVTFGAVKTTSSSPFGPVKTTSPFNNKPYPRYCASPYIEQPLQPGIFYTDTPHYVL